MGLPCMCIGRWIREDDKKWLKVFSTLSHCRIIAIISFVLICVEFYVERAVFGYLSREMYIFTLPLIVAVFYMAVRNPDFGSGSFISEIGRRYSAFIYIIHVLVMMLISHVVTFEGWKLYTVFPIAIFITSLLMAMLWRKVTSLTVKNIK